MSNISSLERGLTILDLLVEVEADVVRRERGLSIQQISNELGVHKSTASRLVATLVAKGYAIPREGGGRGYRLGPAVRTHRELTFDQQRLRELAQPTLALLVEQTGECAHLAVHADGWALVVDDLQTNQPLRVVAGRGRRVPLHCTSAGKCLLAFGMAPIPDQLTPRTAGTITNPAMLAAHLEQVVRQGYALDDEENDAGVRCISAPIFNAAGEAIGCIGIDGPSVRVTEGRLELLAALVVAAGRRLSERIGGLHASTPAAAA